MFWFGLVLGIVIGVVAIVIMLIASALKVKM